MDANQFQVVSGMQQAKQVPIITDNNGNFVAVHFELSKPGGYFYDLTQYLSVIQGEQGYQLPAFFTINQNSLSDDAQISVEGNSPTATNNTIYAIPQVQTTDSGFRNIIFPPDIFRTPGTFNFTFVIQQNGFKYKSSPFLLRVAANMVSVSAINGGNITPYDSVFEAFRANMIKQMKVLSEQAESIKGLFDNCQGTVSGMIDDKLKNIPTLSGNNDMTGINSFGEIILNGNNITHTVTKKISQASGSFLNGIPWGYITLGKFYNDTLPFGIISAQFNVPNNSTFQNASEQSPVAVAQFPKGSCSSMGQTVMTMSGAEFRFDVASDTLLFCGLVTNSFANWGFKVRDVAITIINNPMIN